MKAAIRMIIRTAPGTASGIGPNQGRWGNSLYARNGSGSTAPNSDSPSLCIEANLGPEQADTCGRDLRANLRADYVLANTPFNDSDWFRKDDDVRWQFGVPPKGNANFAWVQHSIHHLAPQGMAGLVLAGGASASCFCCEEGLPEL